MKSSDADTSSGKKTGVSMESLPLQKRIRTEKETEKGARTGAKTERLKEVILKFTQATS